MKLIPDSRGGALLRFALGALVVIGFAAATTAVAGLLQFKQLASEIGISPALRGVDVQIPAPGDPQTLLLIGSDHRAGDPYRYANTDTMMLVRIDANSTTINVLSIPRDLEVQIPEGGTMVTGKLNAAYSVGGPNLLLTILKTQVFANMGFHVNHVIDVNFKGFSDLIDAIGCVYTDVDHRYFNQSAPGPNNYSSINIQPGYQKLCGDNQADTGALSFVRFRHTDSDIVRNARQQDFLRWAKQNYTGSDLFANRDKLLTIFGKNAQTDYTLHSADALENLVILLASSAGHVLKSVPFPAQFGACDTGGQTPCYVTADPTAEQQVYQTFMTPTTAPAPSKSPAPGTAAAGRHGRRRSAAISTAGLISDPTDGQAQASALGRAGMPVYYPSLIAAGSQYCTAITGNCTGYNEPASAYVGAYPREYRIHGATNSFPAYRMTLVLNSALGWFYGVQGTTWMNPPILNHPTQTQNVAGKQLLEYYNGRGKLSMVAWRAPSAVYWVSNTLDNQIPPKQLIGIAASLRLGH